MRFRAVSRAYSVLGYARSLAIVAAASITSLAKVEPDKATKYFGLTIADVISSLQPHIWWVSPAVLGFAALLGWMRRFIGDPKKWKIVHGVLDRFQEYVFGDENNDLHEHRVTLFRRRQFCFVLRQWPWSGWLVPVERSAHTTQWSSACFLAPDDASLVEGIAGMTWNRRKALTVDSLPDLKAKECSEADFVAYAERTHTRIDQVREKRFGARSYYGIPVEVKGERWGVIVVDSRNASLNQKKIRDQQKIALGFLEQTLESL